jgi:antitoxin CcdA
MNRHVAPREPVSLSLDVDLVAEARRLDLDLSRIAEEALRRHVRDEKVRRWQEENAGAIAWNNEHVEKNGVFGEEWRTF